MCKKISFSGVMFTVGRLVRIKKDCLKKGDQLVAI